MKVIILAAGQGSRLRPYTNDRPKSMVELGGRPLISYQLQAMCDAGLSRENVAIVTGYRRDCQEKLGLTTFVNDDFMSTNMVYSLWCALDWAEEGEDLIIAYGDITYDSGVMQRLLETAGDLVLAADLDWQNLWKARAEDFLADAETFKISPEGVVTEVGNRPNSILDIEAQYIGLIKVSGDKVKNFKAEVNSRKSGSASTNFGNMYMTDFLQELIEDDWMVKPALIEGGWLEIDTVGDLDLYKGLLQKGSTGSVSPIFEALRGKSRPKL